MLTGAGADYQYAHAAQRIRRVHAGHFAVPRVEESTLRSPPCPPGYVRRTLAAVRVARVVRVNPV
ncbi:hypothetical protein Amsp01_021450 [Amycolatopsis sp. NBRC 101858]|nr:hypothetical protein Amsp01_021450 [Amycolatopsis sp. NBRC 101858]